MSNATALMAVRAPAATTDVPPYGLKIAADVAATEATQWAMEALTAGKNKTIAEASAAKWKKASRHAMEMIAAVNNKEEAVAAAEKWADATAEKLTNEAVARNAASGKEAQARADAKANHANAIWAEVEARDAKARAAREARAPVERWNHGAEEATVDSVQRVCDGVARLAKTGKIGAGEVLAAERWYRDYALAVMGVFDAPPGASSGGGDAHTAGFARAKAANAFREALAAVGREGGDILRMFVVDGWTMAGVGASLGMDRMAAAGAVVVTLRRLAEHYAAGRPVGRETGRILNADFSA